MNLRNLSDEKLDQQMIESVQAETESTLRVLHHLREVDTRRLFSKFKFKSLLDYAENRLAYPYDQAWRRIEAMRLLKEMPEIESKIADSTLNLTNIGYAQAAFKSEAKKSAPLCKEEKLEFLSQIENKSTRATQKLVAERFGAETLVRETIKPVSATISMLKVPVSDEFLARLEELKGLLAHTHQNVSNADLLDYAVSEVLSIARHKKALTLKRSPGVETSKIAVADAITDVGAETALENEKVAAPRNRAEDNRVSEPGGSSSVKKSRYIQAQVRRNVWERDQAKCCICGSKYKLEFDHLVPFAKNGESTSDNLRLLCRSCNQRSAIECYGVNKISNYLRSPARGYDVRYN